MSKFIESQIECPFYVKEGERFISCEGLLENTSVTTHRFKSDAEKRNHQLSVCCSNSGKKCPHYRNISLLYERGER